MLNKFVQTKNKYHPSIKFFKAPFSTITNLVYFCTIMTKEIRLLILFFSLKKESDMKKTKFLALATAILCLCANNAVIAKSADEFKVGVVDIQKVIENSPKANAVKVDRKNKIESLATFVEKARAEVAKESDANKKKALEDKYNKELNTRKNILDKDYADQLSDLDKEITSIVKTKSKKEGYSLILIKSSVLDGGEDITSEIIKELK